MTEKTDLAFYEFKSPLIVHLELTSVCNHKCIHCYNYWREPGDPLITISRDNLHRIMDNLVESEVHDIVITGGEPLLFPDLMLETIDLAQKAQIRCSLNSNLALMTDKIAAEICKRDVPILTSFHSCNSMIFDEIANREGAFEKVINGIKIAIAHGIPVTANMVVMKKNINQILETGRFLHSIGVTSITATEVHPSQSAKNIGILRLTGKEVVSIFDSLQLLQKDLGVKIGTLTCHPMCLFNDMEQYGIFQRHCTAGITCGAIEPNGNVRPCPHSDENYGNALNESLLEIWPRLRAWRDGSFIPDDCKKCDWVRQCGTGCRMDAKYFHGSYNQPDPYMTEKRDFQMAKPQIDSTPGIDDFQEMYVNPHLRFRKEEFGTFVNPGDAPKLMTKDSAKILQSLSGRAFNLHEVVEKYNLNLEETRYFFTQLLNEDILVKQLQ